jgi:putative redox protein
MDISVKWNRQMSFTGNSSFGFTVPLDAKPESGGNGQGFMPMELIANGLAGCTAMDVISILQKKRQPVIDFEVKVYADRSEEHPRVFTNILIEYIVVGKEIDTDAVERAVELSENKYCPAIAMFRNVCHVGHKITLIESK